ncbi:hypothetical protein Csa_001247 [Cucumis sativus]|nr:hypothetical protein Csa_001247 [Cucumis sativus]
MIANNDGKHGIHGQAFRKTSMSIVAVVQPHCLSKSRRRYLLSSDVVHHPLFQELVDKSSPNSEEQGLVISCEVVLFEHLLWMLENAATQLGSADELVQFYT